MTPDDLAELSDIRRDLFRIEVELHCLKRKLAWDGVMAKARHVADLIRKAGFNPSQLRVPAGNPDGGEWTRDGGGAGGNVHLVGRDGETDAGNRPQGQFLDPYVEPTKPVLVGETTIPRTGSGKLLYSSAQEGDVFLISVWTPGAPQALPGTASAARYVITTWSHDNDAFRIPPDTRLDLGSVTVGTYSRPWQTLWTVPRLDSQYRVLRFNFLATETTPENTKVRLYKMPKAH